MLQWWLGTRKRNTWKYLNPLQYSIDCNINIDTALNIFFTCAHYGDVKTFAVRTISRCPNCESIVAKEFNTIALNNLPEFCEECGCFLEAKFVKNDSEVYFSLIVDPLPPSPTPIRPMGVQLKASEPLTFNRVKEVANPLVDGIMSRMRNL